jgi:hypothetical protein
MQNLSKFSTYFRSRDYFINFQVSIFSIKVKSNSQSRDWLTNLLLTIMLRISTITVSTELTSNTLINISLPHRWAIQFCWSMATARESKDPFDHKHVEHLSGTTEVSEPKQLTRSQTLPYGNHRTVATFCLNLTTVSLRRLRCLLSVRII